MAENTRNTFSASELRQALQLVGRLLHERGQSYEIVVIGGANLALRGVIDRPTVDVDVVALRTSTETAYESARPLPDPLRSAAEDAATLLALPAGWLNGAASSDFALGLPPGYETRVDVEQHAALSVAFAHRQDIVAWKLQAAVDRWGTTDRHLQDLHRLRPTSEELVAAQAWFESVESESSAFWTNLTSVLGELDHDE